MDELLKRFLKSQPEILTREASLKSGTFDSEKRTIEVVLSTGMRGLRYSWNGNYEEELSLDDSAVRMDRLNSGMVPLIDHHNTGTNDGVIGRILEKTAKLVNGQITALAELCPSEILSDSQQRTVEKMIAGFLPGISIGYRVYKWVLTKAADRTEKTNKDLYTASDWEIIEASSVSTPFDHKSTTRSAINETQEINPETSNKETRNMENEEKTEDETKPETQTRNEAPPIDVEKIKDDARAAEKLRSTEIRSAGEKLNLPTDKVQKLIDDDTSIDKARAAMIDMNAERTDKTLVNNSVTMPTGGDETDKRNAGIENMLVHRLTNREAGLDDNGRRFAGMTMLEVGQDLLAARGISHGMRDREDIAKDMIFVRGGSMSVSDFPYIFGQAAEKSLTILAAAEELTFMPFVRVGDAQSFAEKHMISLSGGPQFKETPESGGYEFGTSTEKKESYILKTYSAGLNISRIMLLSDNLDAVKEMLRLAAIGSKTVQLDAVYDLINSIKTMSDSIAFFHATRGNRVSASAPSLASFNAMFSAFGSQVDASDRKLNLDPRYIVVSKSGSYRPAAHQLIYGSMMANEASKKIPQYFQGLELITESRIEENDWMAFTDPKGKAAAVEISYLNGKSEAQIEELDSSRMEGARYGIYIDFGVGMNEPKAGFLNG